MIAEKFKNKRLLYPRNKGRAHVRKKRDPETRVSAREFVGSLLFFMPFYWVARGPKKRNSKKEERICIVL